MNDMRAVIVPKSDQINADDLIAGPLTITITKVDIRPGTEQPVSISFDGDGGKPYKPCKSMARVMVNCWGPDASKYIGASMTLYRDPTVKWGGMEVGGIRISHMTGIDRAMTMALTATKGSKKAFVVKPLVKPAPSAAPEPQPEAPRKPTITDWLNALGADLEAAPDAEAVDAIVARPDVQKALDRLQNGALERLNTMMKAALDRTASTAVPAADDGWPGDTGQMEV
jgi:hypothetical protein